MKGKGHQLCGKEKKGNLVEKGGERKEGKRCSHSSQQGGGGRLHPHSYRRKKKGKAGNDKRSGEKVASKGKSRI